MSADRKPWTVPMLSEAREAGRKLVMLTCYDASFARVLDDNGVDLILVGDSLGMVVQGHDSTLPVQVDDIAYHVAAVARGARSRSPTSRSAPTPRRNRRMRRRCASSRPARRWSSWRVPATNWRSSATWSIARSRSVRTWA